MLNLSRTLWCAGLAVLNAAALSAQTPAPSAAPAKSAATPAAPANPFQLSPEERARIAKGNAEAQADMMKQLGITKLRPGRNANPKPDDPNAANYDPAKANPFPDWPELLTLKNGTKVTTAEDWWKQRRPEIAEDFEREVIGRIPANVPGVKWEVTETVNTTVGGKPVIARRVIGHVDNSAYPEVTVDIRMAVVVPADATGPVPVLMMFGWGNMPGEPLPRFGNQPEPASPPSTDQLIAAGWGYVSLQTSSIQADNAAGLTQGIIGLTNRGGHRTPEQWGALRAWSWGAARALDYLETLPAVDARRVGIEGVSRYGKAALVTMAFEPRFATALIGSSGEGGTKPHRRNFGEAVENLTAAGQMHWMAGNFLKYGAAEAGFGSKNAGDIPVDAHQLIALCAPRPTFISYGIPVKGDAHWLDQQGSYMATVAAGEVFRLLGVKDVGDTSDYRVAKLPPYNNGLLEGQLAWRQHDGGHEDRSNMAYFIQWANRELKHTPPAGWISPIAVIEDRADRATPRTDANSKLAHEELVAKAKQGGIDVYFVGDSITRRWGATDYPNFLAHWKQNFFGWNAGDFGWGADRLQNINWRMENGELDGVNPKVIVFLGGTNNLGKDAGDDEKVADTVRGIRALLDIFQRKAPDATVILTAIFPRNDGMGSKETIEKVNAEIAKFADGKKVRFLNINDQLAGPDGKLHEGMMVDGLHPAIKGYQVWADALKPLLTELLGAPAPTDHAPSPTGDPSAKQPATGK